MFLCIKPYIVCSELRKTGATYENVMCPYVLRLHLGVTSRDLLEKRNDLTGTYGCNSSFE